MGHYFWDTQYMEMDNKSWTRVMVLFDGTIKTEFEIKNIKIYYDLIGFYQVLKLQS